MGLKRWMAIVLFAGCAGAGCEELGNPATSQAAPAAEEQHRRVEPARPSQDASDLIDAGSVAIGTIDVRVLRGRGPAAAGQQLRLVIQVPDDATTASVRGWIGTDARFSSAVAEAAYAEQLGGYELRTNAPDPLPASAVWWIEVQQVGGATHVGAVPLQ